LIADEAWVDTVRLARELGDVSGLLPEGITKLRDIPFPLLESIRAALMFLGFEELSTEDRPPRSIWTNAEALNSHFERIRRDHEARYGGGRHTDGSEEQRNATLDLLIAH